MKQKKLWFKAKNFGWGWYPVTWEGWTVLAVYLFFIWIISRSYNDETLVIPYMLKLGFLTAILIAICYKTGEKPEWRWGFPKKQKKKSKRS